MVCGRTSRHDGELVWFRLYVGNHPRVESEGTRGGGADSIGWGSASVAECLLDCGHSFRQLSSRGGLELYPPCHERRDGQAAYPGRRNRLQEINVAGWRSERADSVLPVPGESA